MHRPGPLKSGQPVSDTFQVGNVVQRPTTAPTSSKMPLPQKPIAAAPSPAKTPLHDTFLEL